MAQKREFTGRLIEEGLVNPVDVGIIKIFDGVIWDF